MGNQTNLTNSNFITITLSSNTNYIQIVKHCSNPMRKEIETLRVNSGWVSLTFQSLCAISS